MMRLALASVLTALASLGSVSAQRSASRPVLPEAQRGAQEPSPRERAADTAPIPYQEAKPILARLQVSLPSELAALPAADIESAWPGWVMRRDADIRARLQRGDEDSVVNLLLFGTTFTRLPRALNDSSRIGGRQRAAEIVRGRTADLVAGIASPGSNERLQFARALVERHGIDPTTPSGREHTQDFLRELMTRVTGEMDGYARAIQAAKADGRPEFAVRSTLYRTRGLSSDTSIRPDFAIDRALVALAATGVLGAGSVRRVAVVGPGLDFTDKAEGHDFYPQQTTQPFSALDSLLRLRLASAGDLRLTALDLSPRIALHLQAARRRAATGGGYDLVLPRERDGGWHQELNRFWTSFGERIGTETKAVASPPAGAGVDVRAVRVRPDVVLSVEVRDVNVVLERLALADEERFDLVIATNVLVYYDVFEQSLALANISSMLRPGGILLSNNVLVELPTTPISSIGHSTATYSGRPDDSDDVVWYRRR